MDPSSSKINVLIVGANGHVGSSIVRHCLERPNLRVNILCRDQKKCSDLCAQVSKAGGKCMQGDLTKPETLKGVCKDIHTVISAVEGDENLLLEGQQALLREAIESKVRRIVPSDFTLDYRNIKEDEHPILRSKMRLRKLIADSPVKGLHIFCGVFFEKIFTLYSSGIVFWETMDQKMALTCLDDVARFTVAAISKPSKIGDVCIADDQLSLREIMEMYNSIRNVKVPVTKMGTLADLQNAIETIRGKLDNKRSSILNYLLLIAQGKAVLKDLNNSEFPEVQPIHLDKFIKDHPENRLGDQGKESAEKKPIINIFSDLMPAGQQQQQVSK